MTVQFGGSYIPELLVRAASEITEVWTAAQNDTQFQRELQDLLEEYVGRPTALTEVKRLSQEVGGARIFLKREDLAHTGAHKINNAIGQVLLARRAGRKRVIAETGAGQHGVATATACALLDMPCTVFMGTLDMERQAPNVSRMRLLGASIQPVPDGRGTLADATSAALRAWSEDPDDTWYVVGSAVGMEPYPAMVRDFQRVIGDESRAEFLRREGALPLAVVSCIGGGSNAIGTFTAFLDDPGVSLYGAEAGGSSSEAGCHSASLTLGRPGVLHGALTMVLQDDDGQILPAHSISAGLDYPGVGPEHAQLAQSGRVRYVAVSDEQALEAFQLLTRLEGIMPALESAHAVSLGCAVASALSPEEMVLVTLSGRGDKDLDTVMSALELDVSEVEL
jgi:tryptophan synthase beta chain